VKRLKSRYHFRNVLSLTLCETGWGLGISFISDTAILPLFLSALGASKLVIGLIPSILALGLAIPQLFSGYFSESLKRKKALVVVGYTVVVLPWLVASLFNFLDESTDRREGVALFLALFAFFKISNGFMMPIYANFIGKVVLRERRGRAYGIIYAFNTFAASLGSIGAAGILRSDISLPQNYALCFLIAFIGTGVGNFFLLGVIEFAERIAERHGGLVGYLKGLPDVIRSDPNFQRYILARIFMSANLILLYFYAVYAKETLGISASATALLATFFFIASAVGMALLGYLGDMAGHKRGLVLGWGALVVGMALTFFAKSIALFYIVSFLSGFFIASERVSNFGLILELCPKQDKTTYLSLANLIVAPLAVSIPLIGGYLIDRYSYLPVLSAAALSAVSGLAILIFSVREPKKAL
jgi:MFS family permease